MSSLKQLSSLTDTMNIQDFFTEDEWNAIYDAMADYQDHGEDETELAHSVQEKITELFN